MYSGTVVTQRDQRSGLGTGTKLAAYGVVLAAMLGGGALVGASFGPQPTASTGADHSASEDSDAGTPTDSLAPAAAGVTMSEAGYTFDLRTRSVPAGSESSIGFVIERRDGRPLEDYDVELDKELHLVVVSRDLTGYAHVHPERAPDGAWSVDLPPLKAGSYRVYADFVPGGAAEGLTLARDLVVTGTVERPSTPEPSRAVSVDGYDVEIAGELVPGTSSELSVTVSRGGEPVTDLQPYLGALGHLVAIRDGDLAYLHVHPLDEADGVGGPTVRFAIEVPTEGTYGLFFDFSHADSVRNASVITSTTAGDEQPPATRTEPADEPADDHGTHGG